jgi:hypothetical protein
MTNPGGTACAAKEENNTAAATRENGVRKEAADFRDSGEREVERFIKNEG